MKKIKTIKSITEYPFISYIMDWRMESENGYIYIEAEEEVYEQLKAAIDKLTDDRKLLFEIYELIAGLAAENENIGFLNGYLTAVEVMQGKLK